MIVLASSLGATHAMWQPQIDALAGDFEVLAYDHRGHGRSPAPPGPCTVADLGQDVVELLDVLELETVSFCGISLGGVVGMWLAINAPERIERVVLACTSAYFGPPEPWRERARVVREEGMEAIVDAVLERWFSDGLRARPSELVAQVRRDFVSTDTQAYAACCEAISVWDCRRALPRIAAPTLALAGADDPSTPPEHLQAIAAAVPGAELVVLPGARHLANIERAGAFTDAVRRHLAT